jgi:hypothetical protein
VLYPSANGTLDWQMELGTESIPNVARSLYRQEGINAFLAKRVPAFKGC